jgi:ribosome-associated protein
MVEAIEVKPGVVLPSSAMELRAVRSSGPGGQNVNKVSSKVELRVDLSKCSDLSTEALSRLAVLARHRFDAEGKLLLLSQKTRDQHRNIEDVREKLRLLVLAALEPPPPPRKATRPSRASVERRIQAKKQRAVVKRTRRDSDGD